MFEMNELALKNGRPFNLVGFWNSKLNDKGSCATMIKMVTLLLMFSCVSLVALDMSIVHLMGFETGSDSSMVVGLTVLGLNVLYFSILLMLALCFYRPSRLLSDAELPSCTVIVPAYNEGREVLKALESVLASDYPAEKLEILAIDDGSADDTWYWMSEAAAKSGGRIQAVRLEKNGGKRHALYYGIKRSTADVIVTVDSDSVVAKDTLRQLNSPFIDPKIGGVAGNIRVINSKEGVLPKMLDVNFVFNFEVMRSAQSVLGSVFCTPGALSSYRRTALLPFVDEWVHQTFMGAPAKIAEDRALSTRLLRDGHRIVFQRDAVALTKMPTEYSTLCKMFLRWGRGDVRETCSMYQFAFQRRSWFDFGIQVNLLMQTLWLVTPILLLPMLILAFFHAPVAFVVSIVFGLMLWGTVPAVIYYMREGSSDSLWAYTFAIFSFFFLFWVGPYCLLTVSNSDWMTRTVRRPAAPVLR